MSQPPVAIEPLLNQKADPQAKVVVKQPLQPANLSPTPNSSDIPGKSDGITKSTGAVNAPSPIISSDLSRQSETVKKQPVHNPFLVNHRDERRVREEETEGDIMEEALLLLDESQKYWVNGELEDALQMLDQAYALLLDTNGNPDIVRQKDDLRLMISKRILAIYNSHQSVANGKRGEIPIVTNADVEKEIRQFQTVERDFFIASYQRSKIYRPVILRELKKAGLPEELSWLPLVESGYKINALSSARALGLWQFIPSTGYKYGLNRDDWVDERMDVEKSTRAAIDYFKDLHAMFGDWLTVLAGYNCGEGRVMRTIASQHINYLDRFWDLYQRLPYETARYVPRFVATLLIVRDPQKYGIDLGSGDPKTDILSYEVAEINRCLLLQDIAQKLETPEETIYILNAELRHRMTPDRPYKLKVP
ncbi:MAG: lytic transglycosylase domain-containing protein, partial [Thermodesulfobacteriota bacterium]